MAALHFAGVAGETVLCPSNTFMATPLAAIRAGAQVEFVDCNREDLCMSFADFEAKAERHRPKAAFLVHIGGHIAFESEQIADYCREHGIFLIEDCAHAHGASWNGAQGRDLRRCRRVLAVRDQDDLHRRGRRARLAPPRGDRARPRLSQLRQADLRGPGPELPHERVHRRARARADRAPAGDRQLEERRRPPASRSSVSEPAEPPRGDDLRALQVHRLGLARALHRPRLRRAVPPHPRPSGRAAELRLGGARTIRACRSTTDPETA